METLPMGGEGKLGAIVRMCLFVPALLLCVAPLLLVPNAILQFLLAVIVMSGLLVAWARYVDRRPFADYGLSPGNRLLFGTVAGLAIGVTSVAIIFAVSLALGAINMTSVTTAFVDTAFMLFFVKMLLVAVWEETFFRGFLFTSLRDVFASKVDARRGTLGALIVSSLLFAAAHASTDHISVASFSILAMNGVVLCIPFLLTGNLGLSIGFHAAWNFAQTKIFGFAMSGNASEGSLVAIDRLGPAYWTGGDYGPEAGLAGLLGLSAALMLFLVVIRLFPSGAGRGLTTS